MSRLKILILVLIIGALAVVFIQNKEPVALKLLCNQVDSQYCLLQTTKIPLAIWISLFVMGGMVTNLISQVFSHYSYTNISNKRYSKSQKSNEDRNKKWIGQNSEPNSYSDMPANTIKDNSTKEKNRTTNSYEASQKPQKVEHSGSNYSYKYRSTDKARDSQTKIENTSIDLDKDVNIASEPEDEDWI